tara:strand:+ start:34 stop:438 length:405 start_codon:yes stop_codon:yes gene_type:complete
MYKRKYYGGGMTPSKDKRGNTIPGMFQGGGGNVGAEPKKRNIFGRIGAGIGNIFRNDANDRSIKYQGYKNPQVGSGPVNPPVITAVNPFGNTANNQREGYNVNTGKFGEPKTKGINRQRIGFSRGGSIGPNGTL